MDMEKIRQAADRVARSLGIEVVDVEWKIGKQRFLRVYIEKSEIFRGPGNEAGVSHKDCQAVSEELSVILDVEDLVGGGRYILEVSSPGLDRKLRKPGDYERFVGRLARVTLAEAVEGSKFFEGRLAGFFGGIGEGVVKLEVKGRVVELPFAAIRKANLVVEF
jgi:ribosome maturation factor RimP